MSQNTMLCTWSVWTKTGHANIWWAPTCVCVLQVIWSSEVMNMFRSIMQLHPLGQKLTTLMLISCQSSLWLNGASSFKKPSKFWGNVQLDKVGEQSARWMSRRRGAGLFLEVVGCYKVWNESWSSMQANIFGQRWRALRSRKCQIVFFWKLFVALKLGTHFWPKIDSNLQKMGDFDVQNSWKRLFWAKMESEA